MKTCLVRDERTHRQTEGRADMTKVIGAFRDYSKAPKSPFQSHFFSLKNTKSYTDCLGLNSGLHCEKIYF